MKTESEFKNPLWRRLKPFSSGLAGTLMLGLVQCQCRAQIYTVLHNFGANQMELQPGPLSQGNDGVLYGTTSAPDHSFYGALYRINPDGSGYSVLRYDNFFTGGGLVLSDTTLYGKTYGSGSYGGTIFKINTDGTGYGLLKQFAFGSVGVNPVGGLTLSGATLYGTLSSGGSYGGGSLFRLNTNGSDFTLLMNFPIGGGSGQPAETLLLSDTNLFGTTDAGFGTIFKVGLDGNNYALLKAFSSYDGLGQPRIRALSGTVLYGTTTWGGGASNSGVIFKINTDGSGYTVLKQFTGGVDGGSPWAGVVLSGSHLFGTTRIGGLFNCGVFFRVNTNGNNYLVLKHFTGSDGANPSAALILSGTTLYGTTQYGGGFSNGVLFSLSVAPPIVPASPVSRTVEVGADVDLGVEANDEPSLRGEWYFNGTNLTTCSTNCRLVLTNVQTSRSGTYFLIASNLFGTMTSAPVTLNVIPVVERKSVPGLKLAGEAGGSLNVEYTISLGPKPNWQPLEMVNLTNLLQYCFDLTSPLPPQRFYRVWQVGSPSTTPSLTLPGMIPAITLTGTLGDKLRLDCINQIGPTDAWVALDTVTLTNTSQLYFDTSAIGQPARLYRIVPVP